MSKIEIKIIKLLINNNYEMQKYMLSARHKGLCQQYVSSAPGQVFKNDTVTQIIIFNIILIL